MTTQNQAAIAALQAARLHIQGEALPTKAQALDIINRALGLAACQSAPAQGGIDLAAERAAFEAAFPEASQYWKANDYTEIHYQHEWLVWQVDAWEKLAYGIPGDGQSIADEVAGEQVGNRSLWERPRIEQVAPKASAPDAPAGDFPQLPKERYWHTHAVLFNEDQMRAYVLADRAARGPSADELHFNAQRLRNVGKLVGLEMDGDDTMVDGCRGAWLGQIASVLRERAAAAPAGHAEPVRARVMEVLVNRANGIGEDYLFFKRMPTDAKRPITILLNEIMAVLPAAPVAAEPAPADTLQDAASFLLNTAAKFWPDGDGDEPQGDIQWLVGSDGSLLVYTRAEYREQLLANIGGIPTEDTVRHLQQPEGATPAVPAQPGSTVRIPFIGDSLREGGTSNE